MNALRIAVLSIVAVACVGCRGEPYNAPAERRVAVAGAAAGPIAE